MLPWFPHKKLNDQGVLYLPGGNREIGLETVFAYCALAWINVFSAHLRFDNQHSGSKFRNFIATNITDSFDNILTSHFYSTLPLGHGTMKSKTLQKLCILLGGVATIIWTSTFHVIVVRLCSFWHDVII